MKITYLRTDQANAAANAWPPWLDIEEHSDLLFVIGDDEERILLPTRTTKILLPDRTELCSYNAGYRCLYEEVQYAGLGDFFEDVQARSNDHAQQAILIAEPTKQTRKRPGVPTVRRVHDRGDGEGAPLMGDIQIDYLVMDIDSGVVPGLDVAKPIPAVRAALKELDPQFADVGIVVQLTAKQDPESGDVLRGRIYVALSRPIHRLQQKWWQTQLSEQAPELRIDLGIMDSARVIYIAPPIFVSEQSADALLNPNAFSVGDPLEGARWFFEDGPEMSPPTDLPNPSEIRTMRRATGSNGGGANSAGIPFLREGEELNIFDQTDELHPSILAATFWMVVRGGDPDQVTSEVTEYIQSKASGPLRERLDHEPARLAGIEKEVRDAALGAAEKFTGERRLIHGVLPWRPRPRELSPEDGVAEAQRIVIAVFEGELKRAMLAGAAGLGKSYEVAQVIARVDQRVDVYNPTYDLIKEQLRIFHGAGCTGISVLSGRQRSGCMKAKAFSLLSDDQYPLTTAQLCGAKDGERICPEFDDCSYVKARLQANSQTKTVFRTTPVLAHDPAWLENRYENAIGKPDTVVVDEDLAGAAVEVLSVPMRELRGTGALGQVFHDALLMQNQGALFLDAVGECFEKQKAQWCSGTLPRLISPGGNEIVAITENTPLDEVIEIEWRRLKQQRLRSEAAASMSESELIDAISKAPGGYVYYELVRGLRQCLLEGHAIWNGAYEAGGEAKVIVKHQMSRLRRKNQSILMIDATADPLITEALLPKTEYHDICVSRNAYVIQVYDHTFSYSWLSEYPARLLDVGAFIRLHAKFMTPGVGHPKDRLGDMFDVEGMSTVTFGRERGINELEHCDIGFVISRVQPRATACEEPARALWPHDELELPGEFVRMPMGYNTRDGRNVGTVGWAHPDPRVNAVLMSKREAGLEQMLDRFRLIHNVETKLVYVFANQPFNVVVDELLTLEETVGPPRLMRLVEAYYPRPLPLSPKHLARQHPDLFKGKAGAVKFCTQVRKWIKQHAWRAPVELVDGDAPATGGRRATMVGVRNTRIVVGADHRSRATG